MFAFADGFDHTANVDAVLDHRVTFLQTPDGQFVADRDGIAHYELQGLVLIHDPACQLLLGLDHQRTDTTYRAIYGTASNINIFNPVNTQPTVRPTGVRPFYDYNQKTVQTGLYAQDQMALDNWRLTLGGREDWVHQGTTYFNDNDATNTDRIKHFSGNAALSYVFDSGFVPYLSYAESFQPASNADTNATKTFKPTMCSRT